MVWIWFIIIPLLVAVLAQRPKTKLMAMGFMVISIIFIVFFFFMGLVLKLLTMLMAFISTNPLPSLAIGGGLLTYYLLKNKGNSNGPRVRQKRNKDIKQERQQNSYRHGRKSSDSDDIIDAELKN